MPPLVCLRELRLRQAPIEHREPSENRRLAHALLEEQADVDGALEPFRRSDPLVEGHQSDEPIEVGLEAALASESLEDLAGGWQIAAHLADPGFGEHREPVDRDIAPVVALRHLAAHGARLLRTA